MAASLVMRAFLTAIRSRLQWMNSRQRQALEMALSMVSITDRTLASGVLALLPEHENFVPS